MDFLLRDLTTSLLRFIPCLHISLPSTRFLFFLSHSYHNIHRTICICLYLLELRFSNRTQTFPKTGTLPRHWVSFLLGGFPSTVSSHNFCTIFHDLPLFKDLWRTQMLSLSFCFNFPAPQDAAQIFLPIYLLRFSTTVCKEFVTWFFFLFGALGFSVTAGEREFPHTTALREHFVQIVVRLAEGARVGRGTAGVRGRLWRAAVASGTKA